jgi:hypothetical protein
MKAYWGSGDSSTHSLIPALDGGKWSASHPGRFTPHGKSPRYPLDRRLGGGTVVKRKIPSPSRESNIRTPIIQPVAQRNTDWAIMPLFPSGYAYHISDTVVGYCRSNVRINAFLSKRNCSPIYIYVVAVFSFARSIMRPLHEIHKEKA